MKKIAAILAAFLLSASAAFAQCDTAIDGHPLCDFAITDWNGLTSAPSLSPAGEARIYFDTSTGLLKCSEDGGAYQNCVGGGSVGGTGGADIQEDTVFVVNSANTINFGDNIEVTNPSGATALIEFVVDDVMIDISADTTLAANDPVYLSGDTITINTLQISDTGISVTDPLFLTGDTFNMNLLDLADTRITAGTGITFTGNTVDSDLGTSIDISGETNLGATDPVFVSGDNVALNTLSISDTHLAVGDPIYLSGDTFNLNLLDIADTRLVAGSNITFTGNTISSSGGGESTEAAEPLFLDGNTVNLNTLDVSETHLTAGTDLTLTGNTIDLDDPIASDTSGNAGTATALAANGSNCSAGSYALGVDDSGAAEGCTNATTEIDSAISTHASDNDAHHSLVTLAGSRDYLTLSGQEITQQIVDISDDTSLGVNAPVLLSGDTIDVTTTGVDASLVSGTAGSSGHCAEWNADGDLVTAGAACGSGGGGDGTLDIQLIDSPILSGASTLDFDSSFDISTADAEAGIGLNTIDMSEDTNWGATDPLYISGDTVDINTLQISDTHIAVAEPIFLTGDTFNLNVLDVSETHLAASTGITLTGNTLTTNDSQIDHDSLSNFVANEHIDWTSDQGATNIHSGNYTDTNTNADTICSGTTTYLDGEGGCDDISSVYQAADADLDDLADGTLSASKIEDSFIINAGDTMAGTLFASNFNLGSDICSGLDNGGALVTDSNGYVVCENDDSGGEAGTTDISDDTNLGAVDPVYLSGDTITLNTLDVSETHLVAGTTLTLTGNTLDVDNNALDTEFLVLNGTDIDGFAPMTFSSTEAALDSSGELIVSGTMDVSLGDLELPNGTDPTSSEPCEAGEIFQDTNATSGSQLYACESGSFVAQGGGGGGGTGFIDISTQSAKLGGDFIEGNTMQLDGGEGAWRLLADTSQTECALWQRRIPATYSSSPIAKLQYSMTSATTNKVDPEIDIMCVTDADSADINTASFDSVNEIAGGTTVPGTVGYLDEISITLSNNDSMTAGDHCLIRLCRDHDDTDDTATGDMEIINLQLQFSE